MGKQHWTSAFSHLEAWLASRPASAAGSSKPGSEISSMMDSGDDVSDKLVISTTDPLVEDLVVQESNGVSSNMGDNVLPITVAATPLTPSTIQPIIVPLSVSGSSCVPLISMPPAAPTAPTAVPLISIPPAAPTATQLAAPTATQLAAPTATPLLRLLCQAVRPNQMG